MARRSDIQSEGSTYLLSGKTWCLYVLLIDSLAFITAGASDRQLNCTVRRCLLMVHILVPSVSWIRFVLLVLLLAHNIAWCASWAVVEGWPPRPFSTTTLNCTVGFSFQTGRKRMKIKNRPQNIECNTVIVQEMYCELNCSNITRQPKG